MGKRTVTEVIEGQHTRDGAGVQLKRMFSREKAQLMDPFLMLDSFDSLDANDYLRGFPWHPHRGIETVTYLISGEIEHQDSLGNRGKIQPGSCQWMSAGSGILHQEMPQESDRMLGVQLWVNLPKDRKMSKPAYRDITSEDVKEVSLGKAGSIRIIAGQYSGVSGPVVDISAAPSFFDLELNENASFRLENEEETLFFFVIDGEIVIDGQSYEKRTGMLMSQGNYVDLSTKGEKGRALVFSGRRLNEPIAWGGPIVMNTKEELDQAFKDLEEGTFIKDKKPTMNEGV
ncbi:MAG TPA: pirin family protein [Eubacteriaceae bacterium]|nr:pirin family protein [Eubacteriaceae bacterium]